MIELIAVDGPLGQGGGPAASSTASNVAHLCLQVGDTMSQLLFSISAPPPKIIFGAEGEGIPTIIKSHCKFSRRCILRRSRYTLRQA